MGKTRRDKKNISLGSKRKVDHYLGLALAGIFELAAFVAGRVFRRNHKNVPFDRVLIMKFNGMGSLACAYPAMLSLKKSHPESELVFWGTGQTAQLAKELGLFCGIIILDDSSYTAACVSLVKNLREIWRFRPGWAFDLEIYSKLSSVLCLLTASLNRVGFISDTTRFRKYLHTHLIYFNRFRYAGDLYSGMLGGVLPLQNGAGRKNDYSAELKIEALDDDGKMRNAVVININTGELFELRRWPLEKFRQLIERILGESGYEVLLIGSGGEHGKVEELRNRIEHTGAGRVKNLAGACSLKDTMRLLKSCRLFITNDSGPMHLAVLTGTPVVAIFGPTHPAHFLPPGRDNIAVLYRDYICSPCVHVIDEQYLPCKGEAPCMSSIDVAEVYEAAKRLLDAPGPAEPKSHEAMARMKAYDRE